MVPQSDRDRRKVKTKVFVFFSQISNKARDGFGKSKGQRTKTRKKKKRKGLWSAVLCSKDASERESLTVTAIEAGISINRMSCLCERERESVCFVRLLPAIVWCFCVLFAVWSLGVFFWLSDKRRNIGRMRSSYSLSLESEKKKKEKRSQSTKSQSHKSQRAFVVISSIHA